MKNTQIIAETSIATVMASSAYAELSLGGACATVHNTGDGNPGMTNTSTSSTVNVDFTNTLANGMGIAVAADAAVSGTVYAITVSSDLGSISVGTDLDSGMDVADGAQGAGSFNNGGRILAANNPYVDGDAASGNPIMIRTSMAGVDVVLTQGDNSVAGQEDERVISIGASTAIAGVSIAAGNTDFGTDAGDHSFMTLGYSVGGFNLGWGNWDSDTADMTQIGASTTVAGLGVGVTSASTDNTGTTADFDAMGIHVSGDLGGAFWVVDYISMDDGAGAETDVYRAVFGVGF
jgi:hypothetical protein